MCLYWNSGWSNPCHKKGGWKGKDKLFEGLSCGKEIGFVLHVVIEDRQQILDQCFRGIDFE
jgi:hypothetical protein